MGLAKSREQATSMLMAGIVFLDTKRLDKSGQQVPIGSNIEIKGKSHPWVSRGGLKLEKAILEFNLKCNLIIALDIGASTGGFTDVLLTKGANKVYAVDVGHGQLDWKLRQDKRVIVSEKTNARYLSSDIIKEPLDAVVCDASFISLKKIIPSGLSFLKTDGWLAALIKPQFEVGKGLVGKGGVVRDPQLHQDVINDIEFWIKNEMNMNLLGVTESPILGPSGNREFVIVAIKK
jgi:23S rRNA (cytidine1920-2'-O)/16S rRNA (cytidine1409-2'-O)-methyltransferase|tara:strand:- start:2717 stop:3418 length:702 start_codon:yes stop_codon:yes gene_type:complete